MNIAARPGPGMEAIAIAGEIALCDRRGALYLPAHRLLVVSDLHLEKGSALARRGAMVPPYDTGATLSRLAEVIDTHAPDAVVSLGDSFHDGWGAERMPAVFRERLAELMRGRDWFWVAGNHDPAPPAGLAGAAVREIAVGGLLLRHEPSPEASEGEIAGHLHPGARIVRRGRSVRRACFATDGRRLVMPAFGAFTGTLNVRDRACARLFDWNVFRAYMLGSERVFAISGSMLAPG